MFISFENRSLGSIRFHQFRLNKFLLYSHLNPFARNTLMFFASYARLSECCGCCFLLLLLVVSAAAVAALAIAIASSLLFSIHARIVEPSHLLAVCVRSRALIRPSVCVCRCVLVCGVVMCTMKCAKTLHQNKMYFW